MALTQSLPAPATEYAAAQRAEITAALFEVNRLWSSAMTGDFDASFAQIDRELVAVLDVAQRRVVAGAVEYVPEVLADTNPAALRSAPEYLLRSESLVGTAGNGLATDSLVYEPVIRAKTLVGGGYSPSDALESAGKWLGTAVGTLLSDTGRGAEKVTASGFRSGSYVRMLTPPSCGRCVILAGKPSRRQTAFLRHPGCDCRNIPAAESVAGDLTVDPGEYMGTLSESDLAKTLGSQSNARAYLDGADVNQLVNAYRRSGGVRPAQVYGRSVKYTTEGTTRRGLANWRMRQAQYVKAQGESKSGGRYLSLRAPRLMPESIYQIARDDADAKRLLRLYGWVL